MTARLGLALILTGCFWLTTAGSASAEVVRFRYTLQDLCGHTSLKTTANGAKGEWRAWALGIRSEPYYCQMRPTHLVTFRHPYANRNVSVPISFPSGTPTIYHERTAIMYTFGTYTIRAEFLPDGSVDVVYNSGIFRPLPNN